MSSLQRSLAFSLSTLLAACAGVDEGSARPEADDPDPPALTDTVITLRADGTIEQSTVATTAEDRQAELARATAPVDKATVGPAESAGSSPETSVLPVSPGCAGVDLWLYDSTLANRLCIAGAHLLFGADSIDLRTVNYGFFCDAIDITGRCTARSKWAGRVHFIYPGINDGRLYLNPLESATAVFSRWTPLRAVDPAQTIVVKLLGTGL